MIADEPIPNGGPTGHVLLVEADAPTRQGLAALLVEHGYRVTTAGTGAEAEDKARRDPPCVLLAALELPDGPDGPTLLDQLRARDPELRAVFMARGGAVPQGEPPQGAVVLTRPVEATRLFSALQAALSSKTEQETAAP